MTVIRFLHEVCFFEQLPIVIHSASIPKSINPASFREIDNMNEVEDGVVNVLVGPTNSRAPASPSRLEQ